MQRSLVLIVMFALALCVPGEGKDKKKEGESADTGQALAKPKSPLNGVPYALPKTALRLEIQINKVERVPGKYCRFNPLFFPDAETNVDCAEKPSLATAIKGFSASPFGMTDPNRIHVIPMDGSWRIARSDTLTLSEGGTVTGFDSNRQDKTLEIVFGFLGNIASVASKFIGNADAKTSDCTGVKDEPLASWLKDETLCANYQALSGPGRTMISNAIKEEGQARGAWVSYSRIKALSGKLDDVLGGTGGTGAPTLVPELKAMIEAELKKNFLGLENPSSETPVYEWVISDDAQTLAAAAQSTKPAAGPRPLRVSTFSPFSVAACGIMNEKVIAIANPPAKVRCADATGAVPLVFKIEERPLEDNVALQIEDKFTPGRGSTFYYVVPSATDLRVEGTCVASDKPRDCSFSKTPVLVAQWGIEQALPEPGKDWAVVASLYSSTGALQSVKISSKALLDKDTIDNPFKPALALIDAKQAADKAAQTKADELTKLERRQKLAEAAATIAEKCKNLDPQPAFCKE